MEGHRGSGLKHYMPPISRIQPTFKEAYQLWRCLKDAICQTKNLFAGNEWYKIAHTIICHCYIAFHMRKGKKQENNISNDHYVAHPPCICFYPSIILEWAVPEKFCPPLHRGGWISRLFWVKYSPGFPGFWTKICIFIHIFTKNSKSTLCDFSLWISRKILKNSKLNSRLIAFIALTSSLGEGRIYLE